MEGQLEGWAEEVLADERWEEEGWAEEPPGQEEIRPPKLITRSRCPVKPHAERGSACLLGSSLRHPGLWSSWKADSIWAGWGEMYRREEGEGLLLVEFLFSQVTGFWLSYTSPFHSWPASVHLRHAGGCFNHMPCQDLLLHGEECKNNKSLQMLRGESCVLWDCRVWGYK